MPRKDIKNLKVVNRFEEGFEPENMDVFYRNELRKIAKNKKQSK